MFLIVSSRVWVIAVCLGLYNFVCLLCGRYGRTGGRTRVDGEKFRCVFFKQQNHRSNMNIGNKYRV